MKFEFKKIIHECRTYNVQDPYRLIKIIDWIIFITYNNNKKVQAP